MPVGIADWRAVAENCVSGLQLCQGNFVRRGNRFRSRQARGKLGSSPDTFRINNDADVVSGMDSNVEGLHSVALAVHLPVGFEAFFRRLELGEFTAFLLDQDKLQAAGLQSRSQDFLPLHGTFGI